jgi:general secretion pathway protein E
MKEIQEQLKGKQGEEFLTTLHKISVDQGISDLHFFPQKKDVELGWRQDGIMRTVITMSHSDYTDIVRRIKFTSKLSLNTTNIPQDGEYSFPHEDYEVKVRVSSLPSKFGEVFTLRLLDPKRGIVPLEKLGFQKDIKEELDKLVQMPNGIMLVTGPTGSGKTTTLYSLLSTLVGTGKNIITLEDPIEYQLDGIVQSQIDHKHKYTFALGLRAILRQDPDVILVGEIRDAETAKTAADAALTGHLVFATLHTNSAIESIPRLLSMGVDPYLLAPALRGILAQRLIRKTCTHCKGKEGGCSECMQTGYKGRLSLPELLTVDKGMRDLILENAEQKKLEEYLEKKGFKTIRERGMELVKDGLTTKEEIARVTA